MRPITKSLFLKKIFLILILFTISDKLLSQPIKGKSGQELLAVLDENTNLGSGLIKGNLTIIKRTGDKITWKINVFRKREDSLWVFIREKGDIEAKFLFKDSGDKVYHYNVLSSKLFLKNDLVLIEAVLLLADFIMHGSG